MKTNVSSRRFLLIVPDDKTRAPVYRFSAASCSPRACRYIYVSVRAHVILLRIGNGRNLPSPSDRARQSALRHFTCKLWFFQSISVRGHVCTPRVGIAVKRFGKQSSVYWYRWYVRMYSYAFIIFVFQRSYIDVKRIVLVFTYFVKLQVRFFIE